MAKTKTGNNNIKSLLLHPISIGLIVIACIAIISGIIILLTADGESEFVENDRKPNNIGQVEDGSTSGDSNTVKPETVQYEGESPNNLSELTGQVRYVQQSNGTLTVSVLINQLLNEPGKCTMTITGRNTGKVYETTSVTENEPSTSSCGLLKLDLQNVASDYYDIEIKLDGDGKKGTIKQEGVEI